MADRSDLRFLLLLACFFLSGFSALLYQTAWMREFSFVFGTSDLAVAAVLAAYMGGLAVGAAGAARFAGRIRRPVLVYGALELGIALCAIAVPLGMRLLTALYVAALGGGETAAEPGALATAFRLSAAFALLLPPTALMGATLPLLARDAVRSDREVGPRIGALYALNTAGAITGTVIAAFFLLPSIGLSRTVYCGAAVNGLVFVAAALLSRGAEPAAPAERAAVRHGAGHWILPAMACSGAVSFAYEVMWTRLLSQILGGSVYAFATMLGSFLLGIALGSGIAGRLARDAPRAAGAFAWAQIGTAVLSVVAFAAADHLPAVARMLSAGAQSNPLANAGIASLVLLPFALCIGATFPLAVRIVTPDHASSAAAAARVYAWNTFGSIVGSIGTGFFLLPRLGFVGTLATGCAINLGLAAIAAIATPPRRRLAATVAVTIALAGAVLQPVDVPWRLLRSSPFTPEPTMAPMRYYAVGRSSTVMLLDSGEDWQLYTNGLPESVIQRPGANPGRFVEARWLGFLPSLLRPAADRALLIGLGGAIALEGMPATIGRVDVVELEPEVVAANREIGSDRDIDPLTPRARILVNDARGALMLSSTRYDAVVSQPSHPWTAGASHLYTREFFELVREHMQPDGVFVQWIGVRFVDAALLRSLVATLCDVFPHVQVYQPVRLALLFAASDEPFDLPTSAAAALRDAPDDFGRYGLHVPEDAAAALLLDAEGSREFSRNARINTDDFNLLATRSSRLGTRHLQPVALRNLTARWEPLAELAPRLDAVRLARRLVAKGRFDRVESLAPRLPELERAIARGLVASAKNEPRAAARHFERALTLDPDSLDAHAGLLQAPAPDGDRSGDARVPTEIATLREARRRHQTGDAEGLAALEDALAQEGPESPLFHGASRLRAAWRLASGNRHRAAEALAIIDRVIARGAPLGDYLIRARAAHMAGRPDVAWAAVSHIARYARPGPAASPLARQALAIADDLPPTARAEAVRARLARLAQ